MTPSIDKDVQDGGDRRAEKRGGAQQRGPARIPIGEQPEYLEFERTAAELGRQWAEPLPQRSAPWLSRGGFIQTYTGRKFYPLDPMPEDVDIEDIAHSLSMQCRYTGHCRRFYSVAEHSVHIADWLLPRYGHAVALAGLLHDASEAYLCDVPRPIKPMLAGYADIESDVQDAINEAFGVEDDAVVHAADKRILADEIAQNMASADWHVQHNNPLNVRLRFWTPESAKIWFLHWFGRLQREIQANEGGAQ